MIAPRILFPVVALILTAQANLFAQQGPPVAPGDRVRIFVPTVDPDDWLVGTVVEVAADTCVLAVENQADTLVLPFASAAKVEVNRGRRSNWLIGAGLGAAVGAGVGAALGELACTYEPVGTCDRTATGALIGGVLLGSVGAAIGSAIKSDRWEEVPLDRLRVTVVPQRGGGVSVGVRLKV